MTQSKDGYLIFPEKCKVKGCFKMTQATHRLCILHKRKLNYLRRTMETERIAERLKK